MISKNKLIVDTADINSSDNVGAYLRSSDGTLITHTTDGAKERLDVDSKVSAIDSAVLASMGIKAEDAAHASGDAGQFILAVRNDVAGSLVSADGDYAPLQVDSNGNLRVNGTFTSNTEFAEDVAHTSGDKGNFILAVRNDADSSLVSADGDYAPLQVDASGKLKVAADISVVNGFEKAEDSAHASGDIGGYMLSVREDTLASSTSASGDYQSFKTDALGRLWMNNTHQTMENAAVSVTTSATDLVASDLANRKKILVQNLGSKKVYIGKDATVTSSNGIELFPGNSIELEVGPGINLHAIAAAGAQDVRVMELA